MPAKQETRVVKIVVDSRQADKATEKLNRQFTKLNRNTRTMTNSIVAFQQGLHSVIAFLGLREFARLSDEYTNLNSRLKLVLGSTEKFSEVHRDLLITANETATSVGKLGKAYVDLRLKVRSVNLDHEKTITIARAMAQSFRISGSTAKEASGATLQLMQALASGKLQGDELRALRENNVLLLHTIEDEYRRVKKLSKDATLDIKELGASGALTPVIILNALLKSAPKFEAQAAKIDNTFSRIFNKFRNNVVSFLGSLETSGSLKPLKKGLDALAGSVDTLVFGFGAFVGTFLATRVFTLLKNLTTSFRALNVAMSANPAFMAAAAISMAAMALFQYSKTETKIGDKTVKTMDLWKSFASLLVKDILGTLGSVGSAVSNLWSKAKQIREEVVTLVNFPMTLLLTMFKTLISYGRVFIEILKSIPSIISAVFKTNFSTFLPGFMGGGSEADRASERQKLRARVDLAVKGILDAYDAGDLNRKLIERLADTKILDPQGEMLKAFGDFFAELTGQTGTSKNKGNSLFSGITKYFSELFKESANSLDGIEKKTKQTAANVTSLIESKTKTFRDYLKEGLDKGKADFENWGKLVESFGVNAFKSMEDTLVDFVQKGKFEIKSLTDSILADFARIQIRRNITIPLYNAFAGYLGGGGGAQPAYNTGYLGTDLSPPVWGDQGVFPSAHQNPFNSIQPLDPMRAAPSPSITKVTVNNHSGSQAKVEEKVNGMGEREIAITIDKRIDDYMYSGRGDKAMNNNFAIKRVGVR